MKKRKKDSAKNTMSPAKRGKKICVLGMGYIGLPTACFFAKAGFSVVGVDVNKKRAEGLKEGILPFRERGLPALFRSARKTMEFSLAPVPADVFIISVPTPLTKKKTCDLSYVKKAARAISRVLQDGNLIVLESTVSPRTCVDVLKPLFDKTGKEYFLAHCPERAIPGNTLYEMVYDDRIVGGIDGESAKRTSALYRAFVRGRLFETDATTAEIVKVSENTYRDVNIALANELARICEKLGVNVWEVIKLANLHPRVNIHLPGPKVGGHCIGVDPWYLIEQYPQSKIIKQARLLNDSQSRYILQKIRNQRDSNRIRKVGFLGVAYKKNVDDPRESASEHMYPLFTKAGYAVRCSDPHVRYFEHKLWKQNDVLRWADTIVLVTDHDVYKRIDFAKYRNIKLVFDTRNLYGGKIKGEAKLITLGVSQ